MTRSSSRAAVLVDTDVFSILYIDPVKAANRGLPVEQLRAQLAGLQVVIAFQTRAEVLAGAMVGSWGERKLADTRAKLDSAPTISIDSGVVDAYASLTAACRRVGHALHDKIHTGDRLDRSMRDLEGGAVAEPGRHLCGSAGLGSARRLSGRLARAHTGSERTVVLPTV